jgi:hypothetical protein
METGMDKQRAASPAAGHLLKQDRRRRGRMDRVSEELIPLLRGTARSDLIDDAELARLIAREAGSDEFDQLRGAKGLMLGAAIGLAFWIGCLWAVSHALEG